MTRVAPCPRAHPPAGAMVLLPGLLPTFYRRHSRVILALTRLSYFSLPLLRDPQDVTVVFKVRASWLPAWSCAHWCRVCAMTCALPPALHRLAHAPLPRLTAAQLAPSSRVFGLVFDVWTLTLGERRGQLDLG